MCGGIYYDGGDGGGSGSNVQSDHFNDSIYCTGVLRGSRFRLIETKKSVLDNGPCRGAAVRA